MSKSGVRIFRYLFSLLVALSFLHGQEGIELKDITAQGKFETAAIRVEGNDSFVTRLAQKAFSMHGAFKVVSSGRSSFDLAFRKISEREVQLEIKSSGAPYAKIFTADSLKQATLEAVDHAIGKMTGELGFFAGKIAFVGEASGRMELWMSDLFFLDAKPLTRDGKAVMAPAWSPDGKSILFTSFLKGFPDLYRLDIDGTQLRRTPFATYRGTNTAAVFSPDGRSTVFSVSNRGNSDIYRSSASSGRNATPLTKLQSLEGSPSWSPRGDRIVITSDQMGQPQLFVMSARGGPMQRLNTRVSRYLDQPEWNPVYENLIAFSASIDGQFQIGVFDLEKQEAVILTSGGQNSVEPTWASDGRHIIYTKKDARGSSLFLIDSVTKKTSLISPPKFGDASQADFVYIP